MTDCNAPDTLVLPGASFELDITGTLFQGRVRLMEETTSTNDVVAEMARSGAEEGACVIARRQRRGRGRSGRRWTSEPGGMYLSVLLRPGEAPERLSRLSVVAAVAVARAVLSLGVTDALIKWPNDVVVRGAKIAGILCEGRIAGDRSEGLICGIGMNLTQHAEDLPPGATSVALEIGQAPPLEHAAAETLRELDKWYREWIGGRFPGIKGAYARLAAGLHGERVRVTTGDTPFEAVTDGIDDEGALRVIRADGRRQSCPAGEVVFLERPWR